PIIVVATLQCGWAILEAAGLSFIGLGVRVPQAEWGVMIAMGLQDFLQGHWWIYTFPGLAIAVAVLGFNLFGDGLQDVLDPKRRRAEVGSYCLASDPTVGSSPYHMARKGRIAGTWPNGGPAEAYAGQPHRRLAGIPHRATAQASIVPGRTPGVTRPVTQPPGTTER